MIFHHDFCRTEPIRVQQCHHHHDRRFSRKQKCHVTSCNSGDKTKIVTSENTPPSRDRKNSSEGRPASFPRAFPFDDRFSFGDDSVGEDIGSLTKDWLLPAETARAGMIESIASENSGTPGPLVVHGGAFRARLLRSSEVTQSNCCCCCCLSV